MPNLLLQLEARTGLSVSDAAKLIAMPRPTYYEYRRKGELPPPIERLLALALEHSDKELKRFIREYVNGNGKEDD